jgi:hypothetical protein
VPPEGDILLVQSFDLAQGVADETRHVSGMKAKDFIVVKRPTLTQITKHRVWGL